MDNLALTVGVYLKTITNDEVHLLKTKQLVLKAAH